MSAPNPVPAYRSERPRSIFAPILLTLIGVVLLLCTTGTISWHSFWLGFAKYWPALLIFWGVAKLAEYLWAKQHGYTPPRLGAGSIVFLIFFIMFGVTTTKVAGVDWRHLGEVIGDETDVDTFDIFGTAHEFTDTVAAPLPGATQIKVISSRGDITVTPSNDNQAHGSVRKTLHSDSDSAADRMNNSTHPQFQQQGGLWVLDLTGGDYERGRFVLDLQLPRDAALSLSTRFGNISVTGIKGNVDASSNHGDISADQITGDASLRLHNGKLTATNITGNVTVDGGSDTNISDISGMVSMTGSFPGEIQLSRVAKPVHFSTSRTTLDFARLDGDLNMELDSMRATGVRGPLKLETRSKTVHLEDFTGDVHIQDSNATVNMRPKAPLGNIDVANKSGEIDLEVPESAGFQLDAESRGGEIQSDFNVKVDNSGNTATATGTVGKGGATVRLKSDHGTIQIKKQ
jgi:hypothetical protein